ncbi:MAG TPA: hypothetical protein VH853_25425 [Polyangia bacterium]|jgi:hypothetical protein|nr:hypothetical protein [Polyangia bacterium]
MADARRQPRVDHRGRRPVFGGAQKSAEDPRFRHHLLFYECFHGDNGAGLGASHQTGWTAVIPALMQLFARLTPELMRAPDTTLADLGGGRTPEPELPGPLP